jgi:hypothetical protein
MLIQSTLRGKALERIPFPHFYTPDFLDVTVADHLLTWFEVEAPWAKHCINGFFDVSDINLLHCKLPPSIRVLTNSTTISSITKLFNELFRVVFQAHVDVSAHRLTEGQRIGIHNDHGSTTQTHRLLIQINRGWEVSQGGLLLLLDADTATQASDLHKYFVPKHRSAVGFGISGRSFHAVSRVSCGIRYTLSYSLHAIE